MRIILNGAMGRLCRSVAENTGSSEIVAGVDVVGGPFYKSLKEVKEQADVIIDCSNHTAVYELLDYAKGANLPVVIATTGFDSDEQKYIAEMSKAVPIFQSANMSVGIALLSELTSRAAEFLGTSFDAEIYEEHHNKKLDAPSGTALMLKDALGRDVPVHSLRGGGIVGEHEVVFAGTAEVIRLSHSAVSRSVFARGAVQAARFIAGKPAGLYGMKDLLKG